MTDADVAPVETPDVLVEVLSQFDTYEYFSPLFLARLGTTRDGATVITFLDGRYIVARTPVEEVKRRMRAATWAIKDFRPMVAPPSIDIAQ